MDDLIAREEIGHARIWIVVADARLEQGKHEQAETARLKAESHYKAAESALNGQQTEDLAILRIDLNRIKSAIRTVADVTSGS